MEVDRGYEKGAHLYDLFAQDENLNFFTSYIHDTPAYLDVGAGTGRLALVAAERAIDAHCVEPSPAMRAMRAVLREKMRAASDLPGRITLYPATAAGFQVDRIFDLTVMSGTYDHFMTPDEQLASLQNLNRHLSPGGTLVFDVHTGLMAPRPLSPAGEMHRRGLTYRRLVGSEVAQDGSISVTLIFETMRGERLIERIEQKSRAARIEPDDVRELLFETGFYIRRQFGDYCSARWNRNSSLLIIEAEKVTRP